MNAQTNITWESVCDLAQVPVMEGVCAKIGDDQVAIFRLSADEGTPQLFAIGNYDPFSDANVLSRGIVGDLKGHDVVASPIYKQHFILETGVCLEDETVKVPSWPVRVQDGKVEIGVAG